MLQQQTELFDARQNMGENLSKHLTNKDWYVLSCKSEISCPNLFTDHLRCLAGSTPTTFTLVLPINLQRISTRRCQSRCSYSRGALRSTQCAPVCTTLLSTMPCQWVCPPPLLLSRDPRRTSDSSNQRISWWEERNRKEWKRQMEWNPHFISTC